MILTDEKGVPFKKPVRSDYETDAEFVAAFHEYKRASEGAQSKAVYHTSKKERPVSKPRYVVTRWVKYRSAKKHRIGRFGGLRWNDPQTYRDQWGRYEREEETFEKDHGLYEGARLTVVQFVEDAERFGYEVEHDGKRFFVPFNNVTIPRKD